MDKKTDLKITPVEDAYSSPAWWYDFRGYFILISTYQTGLHRQLSYFSKNIKAKHLEVAVGTGTFLKLCLIWKFWIDFFYPSSANQSLELIGFDCAPRMLEGAKNKFLKKIKTIKIILADVEKLDFENDYFDSVNIANSLHCFHHVEAALKEVFRVLKPEGSLFVNILLYPPQGSYRFLSFLSNSINKWGMKKGILYTPYEKEQALQIIKNAGFEVIEEKVSGHCLYLKLIK